MHTGEIPFPIPSPSKRNSDINFSDVNGNETKNFFPLIG